jgi:hypothetical protein
MTQPRTHDDDEHVLHHLELRKVGKGSRTQPDRYEVDLVARTNWDSPFQVRMRYSGEGTDPGSLSWDFSSEPAALRHVHVLVTRQERLGYRLKRLPRSHPYRRWTDAMEAVDIDEDNRQTKLF